jgi:hypothetical protein
MPLATAIELSDTTLGPVAASATPVRSSKKQKDYNGAIQATPAACGGSIIPPNSHPQKERQPNWETLEVVALIQAKAKEHQEHLDRLQASEYAGLGDIERAEVKWQKVSDFVNAAEGASRNWRSP